MRRSPEKQTTAAQKARRQGGKFTAALRRETAALSPADLNALGVADAKKRADGFTADDGSWDASRARHEWQEVQWWERMRAGREIRIWHAVIESRAAALDADDTWYRLSLYLRNPVHRGDKGLHMSWEIGSPVPLGERRREVAPIDPAEPEEAERQRLGADYPREVFAHINTRGVQYGDWEQSHVADYCATPARSARMVSEGRGLTEDDMRRWVAELDAERGPLPDGVQLTYWRAHWRAEFLAGYDQACARKRAEEIAATIVDYAGRPLGHVAGGSLEPYDGFRNAIDGRWMHPAASSIGELSRRELWEDYTEVEARAAAGEPVGSRPVLRDMYLLAQDHLREIFAERTGELAAHEAKLHTQPDGTRTYTAPGTMRIITANARQEATGKTPAELREMAEHADHMARRTCPLPLPFVARTVAVQPAGRTSREDQPDHAPVTPYAPAPGAPAELLAQLRDDRLAAQWVPACEKEWTRALKESRRTFSLAALYEVVQAWQARVASAPAVDAFLASGCDEAGFVDLEEIRSRRR
ncbi:DUF6247 family protein [Streptomyces sp. NPDC048483]|uniref:DUF6247 family protein n=1 Tax=Streptomyces sp. NPDC048483 TaxID=3154927 RepID=UPI00342D255C